MTKSLDQLDELARKYGGGTSGNYEFQKGQNRMRLLTFPEILATHFFGRGVPSITCIGIDEGCPYHGETDQRPSLKLVSYVIDRRDEKIKLAELPLAIRYALKDLMEDEDYAFDDFPMPYDVKITYDPDNPDPKAKYRLVGSPKREEITKEERVVLDEAMQKLSPEQYVEKKKAKARATKEFNETGAPPVQATPPTGGSVDEKIQNNYPKEQLNPKDIPF